MELKAVFAAWSAFWLDKQDWVVSCGQLSGLNRFESYVLQWRIFGEFLDQQSEWLI